MDGWDGIREQLLAELEAMPDEGFVVLGEEIRYGEPRKRRLLGAAKPKALPHRYVQFLRIGDGVGGECVGATSFGGDWDVSPDQHAEIRALGWVAPGDDDTSSADWGYPNYHFDTPHSDCDRLARAAVGALGVLGLDPGAPLTLERGP